MLRMLMMMMVSTDNSRTDKSGAFETNFELVNVSFLLHHHHRHRQIAQQQQQQDSIAAIESMSASRRQTVYEHPQLDSTVQWLCQYSCNRSISCSIKMVNALMSTNHIPEEVQLLFHLLTRPSFFFVFVISRSWRRIRIHCIAVQPTEKRKRELLLEVCVGGGDNII